MERHGIIAPTAVPLADLEALYAHGGPYATVLAATPGAQDRATHRNLLGWRSLREQLAAERVDEQVLDRLDAVVANAHHEGDGLLAFLTLDRVLHIEHLPDPPAASWARVAALPSVAPLIDARQQRRPTLVVLADRDGADVWTLDADGPTADEPVFVGGAEGPVHKAASGGWSQARNQRRAENVWRHNADAIADAVLDILRDTDIDVVAVGGDVRIVQLVEQRAGDEIGGRLVPIPEARADWQSQEDLDRDIGRARANAAAEATVTLLRKFREERGQRDRAVEGAADVMAALAASRVDTLLVHDDPAAEETAWFGPGGNEIAATREGVEAMGTSALDVARLTDVALRAAAGTGARAWVVPAGGGPAGGLGAILRW